MSNRSSRMDLLRSSLLHVLLTVQSPTSNVVVVPWTALDIVLFFSCAILTVIFSWWYKLYDHSFLIVNVNRWPFYIHYNVVDLVNALIVTYIWRSVVKNN